MAMDIGERNRLVEQIRKELLVELKQYHIGVCHKGEMAILKSRSLEGQIFIVPEGICREWFKE